MASIIYVNEELVSTAVHRGIRFELQRKGDITIDEAVMLNGGFRRKECRRSKRDDEPRYLRGVLYRESHKIELFRAHPDGRATYHS